LIFQFNLQLFSILEDKCEKCQDKLEKERRK